MVDSRLNRPQQVAQLLRDRTLWHGPRVVHVLDVGANAQPEPAGAGSALRNLVEVAVQFHTPVLAMHNKRVVRLRVEVPRRV